MGTGRDMNRMKIVALGLCLAIGGCAEDPIPARERVAVVEQGARFDITVPPSHVVLQVPRGDLSNMPPSGKGAAGSPRYFLLQGTQGLSMSGWIEPARMYKPLADLMPADFARLTAMGFGNALRVQTQRINEFDVVAYDFDLTADATQANVRASWHDQDTWIDLHLSRTGRPSSAAQLRAEVLAAVGALAVQPKP